MAHEVEEGAGAAELPLGLVAGPEGDDRGVDVVWARRIEGGKVPRERALALEGEDG